LAEFTGFKEEMDVQACEFADAEAKTLRYGGKPSLPFVADIVMADIRRIPNEQSRTGDRRKHEGSVISDIYGEPVREAVHGGVGAEHQRGEWVYIYANERCLGELASRCNQEPA
jgi:hypothetical protein